MSTSRPTIYDVAREAGVSKSLVSLVIRGAPNVSAQSQAAVEEAIRKLNYQPNRAASDLAAKHTQLITILIDDYSNPWFVDLLRGLDEVFSPKGYRLSVIDSSTVNRGGDPLANALSMRPDGIVIAQDIDSLGIADTPVPYVIAGTRIDSPTAADTITNDDALGARLATEHLLDLGHTAIGHLSMAGGAGEIRRSSFAATMDGAGQGIVSSYRGPATEAAGYVNTLELLRAHPGITAVFAANDVMAIGALGAARELGLEVPGDLSIIGYDNTALAQTRLINLSTIDDDSLGVGRNSGALLLALIDGRQPRGIRRSLEPSLVVRGTTAPRAR
ncbi:LacI family DNA-binding transcriptional regulator [Corynebacterium pacaense]|uniref:LacI family DNA-binding transcriptional regulator n=1 Tax=Corynebacterium pacaense TaxID=1816684 RepID=UPI0009BB5923|nr:LacI family DNA-binding transcriptional regulator [Corynebacterium pacaense]